MSCTASSSSGGGGGGGGGLNDRIRAVYEAEGLRYGSADVKDEDELVRRFAVAVHVTQRRIDRIMTKVKEAHNVDICFLIDATGSMSGHIAGVRDSVDKIVNTLRRCWQEAGAGARQTLRFAVVAYRDFDHDTQFEIFPFSEQWQRCVDFCRSLRAFSGRGRDTPEDVLGGLEKAAQLAWMPTAGSRIIFHLGDAPCHGRKYHDALKDNFPDGDPQGRTPEGLFELLRTRGIDYYFGKISSKTDKMLRQFSLAYGKEITKFDVQAVANIAESVIASVQTTMESSVASSKCEAGGGALRQYQLVPQQPDWGQLPEKRGFFIVFELPESVADIASDKSLVERRVAATQIKVAPQPFAEGSQRIAYRGLDLHEGVGDQTRRSRSMSRRRASSAYASKFGVGPVPIVLKESRRVMPPEEALRRCKSASEIQTIASFMAQSFNWELGCTEQSGIKFLKTKTLVLHTDDVVNRPMSYEKQILRASDFFRFTNNAGFSASMRLQRSGVDPVLCDLVVAYSHWTHHATNGFLMVVDLQGCLCEDEASGEKKALMTDPAIHCLDVTRYGPLNFGRRGMEAFFDTHTCNDFCRRLRLRPRGAPYRAS